MVSGSVVATLMVVGVIASQISVPWVAFEPGSASSADDRVEVTGAETFVPDGDILFLTVRQNRLNLLELALKSRDTAIDIRSEREVFGDGTPQEAREQSRAMMVQSKSNAELVALTYLGYDAFDETGVIVASTEPGSAADGALAVDDVITKVDDVVTNNVETLIAYLGTRQPGDTVTLSVEAFDGTTERTISVNLGPRPDGSDGGYLGISSTTRRQEATDLPLSLDIDSGKVGGNSAGLAFTLAIIDELTPGSLTGGNKVAVTGTIELNGSVGEVGGIPQKVVAAQRSGANYMLVPSSLAAHAEQFATSITVLPVGTLDDALAALASIGGNASELALPAEAPKN